MRGRFSIVSVTLTDVTLTSVRHSIQEQEKEDKRLEQLQLMAL